MSEGTFSERDYWIGRRLELERLLARRSVFLFGPRQTGKTTYVRRQLGDTVALTFTLLDQGLLTAVLADPTRIRREVEARDLRETVVCIDEIREARRMTSVVSGAPPAPSPRTCSESGSTSPSSEQTGAAAP